MNRTKKLFMLSVTLLITATLFAQTTDNSIKLSKEQHLKMVKSMSKEKVEDYYRNFLVRKPNTHNFSQMPTRQIPYNNKQNKTKNLDVPENMIFPIESDEVQAILIEWPYLSTSEDGKQYAEAIFDGYGIIYNNFGGETIGKIISSPMVGTNNEAAILHAKLTNAIQKHAQVWIDLWYADDTITIKEFMQNMNMSLKNYRFFIHPGNSFWARDWGPVAFYYGDDDKIAFADFEYYGGRPLDDQLPIQIANDLGWKCFTNTIEYEGGNILVDGLGSLFTTSAVYSTNQDNYGLYYIDTTGSTPQIGYYKKTALSQQQVRDSIKHLMNLKNITVVPALKYDGGTGHIDLYADMWEETGFVAAKYPKELSSWSDAKKAEQNIDTFTSQTNYFGKNYDVVRVPLPRKDNGKWYSSASNYNTFTRCWANHTFVNDAIIQPVFYDTTLSSSKQGDVEGNKAALEVLKKCYPGYIFEEIDVRSFDGLGGAIHCITKQIPAENPIRIYHQPARWYNTTDNGEKYKIEVFSQNKSGIKEVKIFYRTASDSQIKELQMTSEGNNKFSCEIALNANADNDTLFYYISSTSNNGKTITKPMTAKNGGIYTMPYGKNVNTYNNDFAYKTTNDVGINNITKQELNNISEIYPNPATDNAKISLNNNSADLYYRIINLKGQIMISGKIAKETNIHTFDTKDIESGNYWLIITDGNLSTSRQLIIAK